MCIHSHKIHPELQQVIFQTHSISPGEETNVLLKILQIYHCNSMSLFRLYAYVYQFNYYSYNLGISQTDVHIRLDSYIHYLMNNMHVSISQCQSVCMFNSIQYYISCSVEIHCCYILIHHRIIQINHMYMNHVDHMYIQHIYDSF